MLIVHSLEISAQEKPESSWYYVSPDKIPCAAGIDSAYKLLQNVIPEEVVVAVIDAGVDVSHIELKNNLWVNEDEIPGNNADDDRNGYVDDIHGWNFLGNASGKNIQGAPYEYVRIYDTLRKRFAAEADTIDALYPLYAEVSEKYKEETEEYHQALTYYNKILEGFSEAAKILNRHFGHSDYSMNDIKAIKADRPDVEWGADYFIKLDERGVRRKDIESRVRVVQSILNTKLNPDYHPRREIIGDDPLDISDSNYGNNDYAGGTASHGTAVAGIIGADHANDIALRGIAPGVRIMTLRVVPGGDEWDKDVALAIRYAVDNGADIINGSFGKLFSPANYMVDSAIRYAEQHDVLIVVGAGNDAKCNDIKPNHPNGIFDDGSRAGNFISVGACEADSAKLLAASFSNYGREQVDIFAPGVDIPALNTGNRIRTVSGTSAAAPVVSGIAALIKSCYPTVSAKSLKQILMQTATDYSQTPVQVPGSPSIHVPFKLLCNSAGTVNAYEAVLLTKELFKKGEF